MRSNHSWYLCCTHIAFSIEGHTHSISQFSKIWSENPMSMHHFAYIYTYIPGGSPSFVSVRSLPPWHFAPKVWYNGIMLHLQKGLKKHPLFEELAIALLSWDGCAHPPHTDDLDLFLKIRDYINKESFFNSLRQSDAFIVNWTLGSKLHWSFNQNQCIFIQENAFEYVICKMASTSSQPQWVNHQSNAILHSKN